MRRSFGLLLVLVVAGLGAAPARAAAPFKPCKRFSEVRCGIVDVPLDRSGRVPGVIKLHVRRVASLGPRTGAVFALNGGPGGSALSFTDQIASLFKRALDTRDLVVFDERGTGRSGLLRCPTLEGLGARLFKVSGAAADCASTLGPRRAFYTTRDSVEDIEAIRRVVGVERITLYGISYGTKTALAYAARYPGHVERLVLDSVVDLDGPDPFGKDILAAMPRVLGQLCANTCGRITADPTADVASLVAKLGAGLIRGPLVKADGQAREARLGRLRLFDLLVAGDFDPTLRSGFPGAVRSALAGDAAPILRLAERADSQENEPVGLFNPAVFTATQCEEGPLPWARSAPLDQRLAQAHGRLNTIPDAALRPFDRTTAFASQIVELCQAWPTAPEDPSIAGALPDVPALILSGEDDLRTPLEGARLLASRLPHATLVQIPDTGHDVLDSELVGCSRRALRAFFRDAPIMQCRREARLFRPDPIAPTSLAQVPAPGGMPGKTGRTLGAVGLTLRDVSVQLVGQLFSFNLDILFTGFGGLRGGRVHFGLKGIRLTRVVYVPGVKVSGFIALAGRTRGSFRISGSEGAHGSLRLKRDGTLVGRLGGRRVRLRLSGSSIPGGGPFVSVRGSSRLRRSSAE